MTLLDVDQSSIDVTIAVSQGNLDRSCVLTPSSTRPESALFGSFTESTAAKTAQPFGTTNTESGSREQWRAGYQTGLEHGAARYFNSPTMEGLALELTFLRALALQQQRRADFWHERFADAVKELMRR